MKINLQSDIHIGFRKHYEPNLTGVDLLILAGDVGERLQGFEFCERLLLKYPEVQIIHVAGNHEFYTNDRMEKVLFKLRQKSKETDRYYFLENESVVIEGIRFIGSTLWTSLNNKDPMTMYTIQNGLNDYNYIRSEK